MKHTKTMIMVLFLILLVLGYYFYLSNIRNAKPSETAVSVTKVQEVLLHNLDIRYPPTPREVIRLYAEISKCLYNESYTEEELIKLTTQLRRLFDGELLEENPWDRHLGMLKKEIQSLRESGHTFSSYMVSEGVNVEYYIYEGYECAKLHCVFNMRAGTKMAPPGDHLFVMRKDEGGRWKILGWQMVVNGNTEGDGEENP